MKDRAIVLAAFGTSTEARDTYSFFEKNIRRRFAEEDIFWSFTSKILRKKTRNDKEPWKSPAQVLKTLGDLGYKNVVIQSLHVVAGIEFEKLTRSGRRSGLNISVGLPLLSSEIDCYRTIDKLVDDIPDPDNSVTVFVGHGTPHSSAAAMYMQFEECVRSQYPFNVHVSMIEGPPYWKLALEEIRKNPLKKIKIIPLMFVAGDHILNDVLGDDEDSWKTQLEGYEIDSSAKGLGYNKNIHKIYFDHMSDAIERL